RPFPCAPRARRGRIKLGSRHSCRGCREEGAELVFASLRRELEACQRFKRLVVLLTLDGGLGAGDRRLDLSVLVPGLSRLQVRDVDAEPLANPAKRLFRRPRLPTLDLAHVLLREAVARQLRLAQPRGPAKLP